MEEPENHSYEPSFSDRVRGDRLNEMVDLMVILNDYLDRGLDPPGRLSFDLPAGQRIYTILGDEWIIVAEEDAPLPVYLDPARRLRFPPEEQLFVGAITLDTMMVRFEFAAAPGADMYQYTWLRLEQLLPCLDRVQSPHAQRLLTLWQLGEWRRRLPVRPSLPPPDAARAFFGPPPFW